VPCLLDPGNEGEFLNQVVHLEIYKLLSDFNVIEKKKKKPCYFSIITNNINSQGVPFYCSRNEQEDLKRAGKTAPNK
jgi:hypothetical protein